ncbi:hypothetical protein NP493_369g01025 [Ridgeia piscesae]|uniref:Uncharacterized protein n=1 Tax=Ridgeia piscesae TaxID=27915 RepID=A0AAD9L3Z6_RIDPI|nr:hypothetical protein NP493_369g01025 [Ridgeia piscesae]
MEPDRVVFDESTGNSLHWKAARPRVYRYVDTTHRFQVTQTLDSIASLSGIATFVSAGSRYVVVKNYIYLFNNSTGLFERRSIVPEMSDTVAVSALKRASGEVVFAFANPNGMSMAVAWSDESPPTVSKAFFAAESCSGLKLFEMGTDLYMATTSYTNSLGVSSSVWLWTEDSRWQTIQTLEQTKCGGNGVDVIGWQGNVYLVVVCSGTKKAVVFRKTATQGRFKLLQTFEALYPPTFFTAGGALFLAVPRYDNDDRRQGMMYRLNGGRFDDFLPLGARAAGRIKTFTMADDVYLLFICSFNTTTNVTGTSFDEYMAESTLYKWI